ncbi:hypothetical protein [Sinomonas sp. P10A9]|uniref:Arc-like DNA binding dprotein n=1 Tax=Sinomonas puerhi TaxID=3238584 RepID=A0AB39KY79_9MICC
MSEETWTPPRWVAVFSKAELQQLAVAQDQRNRELRNIITRLREQLRAQDGGDGA